MYFKEFSIDNPIIFEKEDELISYFENNIKENQLYDNCKGYISLRLSNAIIKCNFNLRNINFYFNKNKDEFYFNFNFNNIIFEGEFNCYISKHSNIKFHFCYLSFNDVVFEKDVYFSKLKLIGKDNEGNINFYNVNFKSGLYFFKTKFYNSNINFSNICCDSFVEFNFSKFYVKDKFIAKYYIHFQYIDFYKTLSFEGSMLYNMSLNFNDINFYSNVNFNFLKIIFNTKIKLAICERVDLNINNSYFSYNNKSIKFTNMISNCHINFFSNELNNSIDFSDSKFYNNFLFDSNIIIGEIIFSNVKIFKKANFINIKEINNSNKIIKNEKLKMIFDNLIFKDNSSTLYIDNINYEKLLKISFQNIDINGKMELRNIEVDEADFKGTIINGGYINPVNFKVHKFANRESALFLKQQAYARNNAIDALQYKAKEIEKHKEDLIKDWQKNKDFKTFGDIVSIVLSSLYSDNGQNWIRALGMTIFITAFCFTVFYMPDVFYIGEIFNEENYVSLYFSSYKNVFNNLIKYLIPTDYDLIKDYTKLYINYSNTPLCDIVIYLAVKIFGVLVYFLGKVLFWYGSVQTVQAFRKFAKGA